MFYLVDVLKTWAWDRSSQITQRNCSEDAKGGARIYEQVVRTPRLLLMKKKNSHLKLRNLELFHAWEDAGSGLTAIIPWIGISALWVSVLCFLILSLLRVPHPGSLEQVTGKWLVLFFPSCVPSGLTIKVAVVWWLDGCHTLFLLTWQAIF